MPDSPVDPSTLEGDALRRWYQRTPADIEQERQAARMQQYNDFFGGLPTPQSPTDTGPHSAPSIGPSTAPDVDQSAQWSGAPGPVDDDAYFDTTGAGPDDGGELSLVGNPANRGLRREWEQKWGQQWPKDPVTGRNYDVAHIVAKADGGKDHVDNIRPMHPADHMAEHIANGDMSRWARRFWIPDCGRPNEGACGDASGAHRVREGEVGSRCLVAL